MGIITTIVTLATLAVAPQMQFTSDSTYTSSKILDIQVQENYNESEELVSKDLIFKENYVLGYTIYDDPSTPYIDGLKVDDTWVEDWKFENYDDSVAHTISVKTVYSDDIGGALAAAGHGDFSLVIKNPIMVLQFVYFSLAIIMVATSMLASLKSKLKKAKEEHTLEKKAEEIIKTIVTPVFTKLKTQNQDLIEAMILSQSGDTNSKLAMIELLKKTAVEDVDAVSNNIKESIKQAEIVKTQTLEKVTKTVQDIAKGTYVSNEQHLEDDGTSI